MKIIFYLVCLTILSFLFISCSSEPPANVVEVAARDYYFHLTDSIPSGWTTFRLINEGHADHFFFLTLLPENIEFERYREEVMPAFLIAWDSLKAGVSKPEAGAILGSHLPQWYISSAKVMGGTGLIAPGKTAETTMKLDPGNYVMECYVKTEEGKFHGELGMVRPITITEKPSEMEEPDDADIELTLTNFNIESKGKISSGHHIVAVHFKEHPEFGLGNDIHLVRLDENTNLNKVIMWMDWMNIDGLRSPSPAEFLGGTQEMPVGYTAYFTIDLEPGRYAWISESSAEKGKVKEFIVD